MINRRQALAVSGFNLLALLAPQSAASQNGEVASSPSPFKVYFMLWRKPGMSTAEFIDYYENKHAALIRASVPQSNDFRRNFPIWEAGLADQVGTLPFDVLTATTYGSLALFEAAMQVRRSSAVNNAIEADEAHFLNSAHVELVPVEEVIDQAPNGTCSPAPATAGGAKLLRLVRRPAGADPPPSERLMKPRRRPRCADS